MHIIAINGSPRKSGNTATLLERARKGAASQGATTEIVHLYDLDYKGCVSCFACKRKDTDGNGVCAYKDGLSPILERIMQCDGLLLGSPIYFGDVSGMMRSFLERLLFMNHSYNEPQRKAPGKHISSAFFFTMNVTEEQSKNYRYVFDTNTKSMEKLGGSTEYLASFDTHQFTDYEKYAAKNYDPLHKKQVRETRFEQDCKKSYEVGARLAKINE